MSLSAEEKLRVAHVLDGLGIHIIEAGFPASNPKEEAFFELLARETFATRTIARVRDDPPPRRRGRRRPGAARCSPTASRRSARSSARRGACTSRRSSRSTATRTCAMIADSVAFLVRPGQARRSTTPSTSSTATRRPATTRCAALRAAAEAGAEWVTLCDTNGASLPHEIAAARARGRRRAAARRVGIHCHDDAECGVANSLAAVAEGAALVQGTMNGYGERCGNANLVSIIPNLQLKLGYDVPAERSTG